MQSKVKEKLEQTMHLIEIFLTDTAEIPHVLMDRIVVMMLIATLFLSIGVFAGYRVREAGFILWSVVIAVLVLGRCIGLFYKVKRRGYKILEGRVEKIHEIPATSIGTITLKLSDGQKAKLLLGTQRRFRIGAAYRFYFCRGVKRMDGGQQTDAGIGNSLYLGCEEVGN